MAAQLHPTTQPSLFCRVSLSVNLEAPLTSRGVPGVNVMTTRIVLRPLTLLLSALIGMVMSGPAAAQGPAMKIAYSVGVPEDVSFAAEYPARTCPCQRFDAALADRSA
jgi:hypothetical protein